MNFYWDEFDLLVTKSGDAGDCAANMGRYHFGLQLCRLNGINVDHFPKNNYLDFKKALDFLEVKPGIYRRHPAQWNDPNDFSRDQQTPIVLAMGAYGMNARLSDLYHAHKDRWWKYQNKDWANPNHINFYKRAFGQSPSSCGDLFLCGDSYFRVFDKDPNSTANDLNHTCAILQALHFKPTSRAKEARDIYLKAKNIMKSWESYHLGSSPDIHEVFRPLIEKFLKQ